MALLGHTQMRLVALALTVFLSLSSTGEGSKQELWLYKADGTSLYFHTYVPDLADYSAVLPKITKYCASGYWLLSESINYQDSYDFVGTLNGTTDCRAQNLTSVKSLRHFAANDTATDAISLYSGRNFEGDEIFATKAKTDISILIQSLAATGTSDWMVYEGKNFDGKSSCFQVPFPGYELSYSYVVGYLNMTTIGSVFKGCDLNEIRLYRESFLL